MEQLPLKTFVQGNGAAATAADLFVEALYHYGVEFIFANLGTDHAGIIEALARHKSLGIDAVPKMVLAQHEMIAISMALGYAQLTGRPQAVMVHVDIGTANLGAGLHGASRGRVPVLLFAGRTPLTAHKELAGGRNRPVHFQQDVYDQAGLVREYVKWDYELRVPHNVVELTARSLQMATSPPGGPVYLTAAREILEMEVSGPVTTPSLRRLEQGLPQPETLAFVAKQLCNARKPLLLTNYLGQDPDAVAALIRFAETFGVGVVESGPRFVNFPTDHELHLGFNSNPLLPEADLVLVVSCDVPWLPSETKLSPEATVIRVDADPLQSHIPYYPFPAEKLLQANPRLFLESMIEHAAEPAAGCVSPDALEARLGWARAINRRQRQQWSEKADTGDRLTAAALSHLLAAATDESTVYVDDSTSNKPNVLQQIARNRPGSYIAGHGLGWGLGAALGAKLAHPERDVVALVGDGAYVFGVPSGVHWAQRAYNLPFLTVIYNNGGWQAVKNAVRSVHPHGKAVTGGDTHSDFVEPAELSRVVNIVDGKGFRVDSVSQARAAIQQAIQLIRSGVPVVIDARLER